MVKSQPIFDAPDDVNDSDWLQCVFIQTPATQKHRGLGLY